MWMKVWAMQPQRLRTPVSFCPASCPPTLGFCEGSTSPAWLSSLGCLKFSGGATVTSSYSILSLGCRLFFDASLVYFLPPGTSDERRHLVQSWSLLDLHAYSSLAKWEVSRNTYQTKHLLKATVRPVLEMWSLPQSTDIQEEKTANKQTQCMIILNGEIVYEENKWYKEDWAGGDEIT